MNTQAIERIKGYCCEVTQEQWDELVRVADEVGCAVGCASRASGMVKPDKFARYNKAINCLGVYFDKHPDQEEIPFPDFLAKLKGGEQWQPKAGEMVEVSNNGESGVWESAKYIGPDVAHDGQELMVCVMSIVKNNILYTCFYKHEVRPLRPTITRTEAERLLNKRIID
jgi:hypothetical protein